MRRGDVVVVTEQGDFGKPRPAVVVQSDLFNTTHATIVVCLMTSDILDEARMFRLAVEPTEPNGLWVRSDIMVDKVLAISRGRIGKAVGRLDAETMLRLDRTLALVLGLGD